MATKKGTGERKRTHGRVNAPQAEVAPKPDGKVLPTLLNVSVSEVDYLGQESPVELLDMFCLTTAAGLEEFLGDLRSQIAEHGVKYSEQLAGEKPEGGAA